jgi:uncharacterized protein YhbP (UPF0306 family)
MGPMAEHTVGVWITESWYIIDQRSWHIIVQQNEKGHHLIVLRHVVSLSVG